MRTEQRFRFEVVVSKYALACSVTVFAAVTQSKAADWRRLRGPNYNAISPETGLAEAWPPSAPA